MTRDDVYDMVKEAGLDWHAGFADDVNRYEVLVSLARAQALEEAVQLCLDEQAENRVLSRSSRTATKSSMYLWMAEGAGLCAGAIRALKST